MRRIAGCCARAASGHAAAAPPSSVMNSRRFSFDHLVGAGKECLGDGQADPLAALRLTISSNLVGCSPADRPVSHP